MALKIEQTQDLANEPKVILDIELPGERHYRYNLKRLTRGEVLRAQIMARKNKSGSEGMGLEMLGTLLEYISTVDGNTMLIEDLISEIQLTGGDAAIEQLVKHIIHLATADFVTLKAEGVEIQ